MYALNEKNEYELVLLEPYKKIDFIYEIDKNNFIFGINLRDVIGNGFCGNSYSCYYTLLLDKIELKKIGDIEIKKEQNNYDDDCFDCFYERFDSILNDLSENEKQKDDNLKVKEKLKLSFVSHNMFKFQYSCRLVYDYRIHFSDFVILKNKFFLIMVENRILVFDMANGKKIKAFDILGLTKYVIMDIKKWSCKEDNEFILITINNVILFKLIEEKESKLSLNVLKYAYCPDLDFKKSGYHLKSTGNTQIKKINSQNNRFYIYKIDSNTISIY